MAAEDTLLAFAKQVEWSRKLGSPFMAALGEAIAQNLSPSTAVGRRLLDWPGQADALGDALVLRLTGALHALVRRGDAPSLAAAYPPNSPPKDLWPLIEAAFVEHEAAILPFLDLAPQTNEVGRSGALMAGLKVIAAETGLPLRLYELGSSAGLNLNLDRFSYRLGELETGDPASKVRIAPDWKGPSPPDARVEIIGRRGVDISPLDVQNPSQRERLPAYVWPDQSERLARVLAAIDLALIHPPPLEQGEAAAWLEAVLTIDPEPGIARVVFHTIAFQYFPPQSQARIRAHLASVGASATKAGPLAWLRLEADPEFDNAASLRLTLWPDGAERVLGVGHPHGTNFRFF